MSTKISQSSYVLSPLVVFRDFLNEGRGYENVVNKTERQFFYLFLLRIVHGSHVLPLYTTL